MENRMKWEQLLSDTTQVERESVYIPAHENRLHGQLEPL